MEQLFDSLSKLRTVLNDLEIPSRTNNSSAASGGSSPLKRERKKRIVKLNIGGQIFTTSLTTLTSQETFFSALFSGNFELEKDEQGAYFIDRDPRNFHLILNYLRGQEIFFDDLSHTQINELASDCQFYQVQGLLMLLQEKGLIELQEVTS